jgi:hypothetical protein
MRVQSALAALALLIVGCANRNEQYLAQMESMVHEIVPAERTARLEFRAEMRELLAGRKYARLAAIADSLRRSRAEFGDGTYALLQFVSAFSLTDTPQEKDVEAWQASIRNLELWRAAVPDSPLPDVALAQTFVSLGWKSRGGGYAFTVRDTGWAGFTVALKRARDVLDTAGTKRPLGIEWYLVSARVGLGQGWPTEDSQKLFEGAIACDSTCAIAYWQRANFLLPRWYGAPGEWEAWLDNAVSHLAPDEADRVYASVCMEMSQSHRNLYQEATVSWPRIHHGLMRSLARHPDSQALLQEFAFNAVLAGDVHTAHEMLRLTGPRYDLDVWRSKRSFSTLYIWVQARDAQGASTASSR